MSATANEKKLKAILGECLGGKVSFGKKIKDEPYISVDFTYKDSNDILYLIEVESDNKAKIDVGEYVLLNLLFDQPNEDNGSSEILSDLKIEQCCFLTILCHAKNTPQRVSKVLEAVKQKFSLKLKHKSIKMSDIKDIDSFIKLIQI